MSLADLNAAILQSLNLLQQVAPSANSAASAVSSATDQIIVQTSTIQQQIDAASGSFANLLKQVGQYQVFGGMGQIGPNGEVGQPVAISDLYQKLAVLIQEQNAVHKGTLQTSASEIFNIEDSIQKIVQIIRTWGGPAASAFNLEAFKHFLSSGGGAAAVAQSIGVPAPGTGSTTSGGAATLGNDAVAKSGSPASGPGGGTGNAALPWSSGAPYTTADAALTAEQKQLDALNTAATTLNAAVSEAQAKLQDANDQMAKLATNAGIDNENVGISKLNSQLQDAQATLQYLQDKGRSAADVTAQQNVVTQIQKQLDEANKQLRITTYEFEHSPAYKQQMDAIAAAQKNLDAKQKAADANQAKIDALQKKIDDATKAATDAANTVKKVGGEMVISLSTTGAAVTKSFKAESVTAAKTIAVAAEAASANLTKTMAAIVTMLRKGVTPTLPITGGALIPQSVSSARSMGLY